MVNNILYINCSSDLSLTKKSSNVEESSITTGKISTIEQISTSLSELSESSVNFWANKILCTADPKEKIKLTNETFKRWNQNQLEISYGKTNTPDQPLRSESLTVIDPGKIRRGKGGTIVI